MSLVTSSELYAEKTSHLSEVTSTSPPSDIPLRSWLLQLPAHVIVTDKVSSKFAAFLTDPQFERLVDLYDGNVV